MDIKTILKCWEKDKGDRATIESEWQEIADYCFPRRDFTTERTQGDNRRKKIYDSVGVKSVLMLASALHGNLIPVQTRWFYLNPNSDNRDYWEGVQNSMLSVFASPESRFAVQAHEWFLDTVAFGTGIMGVFKRDGEIVFKTLNLRDCWIRENQDGVIDTIKYSQKYTAEQMIAEFGEENVHENIRKAVKKNNQEKFEVLYCVGPRYKNSGRGSVATSKPYYAMYVDVANKHQLGKESGYDDFPFIVNRFSKRSGETYGYGPGAQSISEVKMLNQIVEVMFRAASKNADPPILSPVDGVILPMRLDPGGVNFYNPDVGTPEFWSNNFRPDYMDALIEQKRSDIEKIFFIDWMTLPNNDRMTATETMQRAQDSFKNMSAINARMESEGLSALIKRVFVVGVDLGKWDQPPVEDQGRDVRIEYTSPVALAQKSISANSVLQGLSAVAQLAQFDQSVAGIIKTEEAARDQLLNTYFLPSSYVRDEFEMEEMRQAQAGAQEQQAMMENASGMGSAAKDVADAMQTLGGVS